MIPKFKTTRQKGQWETTIEVAEKYAEYKNSCKDGTYYYVLFPEVKWNTEQMRKYLHGPVFDFILAELRKKPYVTTKTQIKKDFKNMFGPKVEKRTLNGVEQEPISTSTYSVDEYHAFINRIDEWCMDKLKVSIPSIEQVAVETLKELNQN